MTWGVYRQDAAHTDEHDKGVSRARRTVTAHIVGRVTCESCGAVDDELHTVHRMYVTPADWDTDGSSVTVPGTEQWCFACCTMYPHAPGGPPGPVRG